MGGGFTVVRPCDVGVPTWAKAWVSYVESLLLFGFGE